MFRFWPTITGPLLQTFPQKVIVEVGISKGDQTRLLLEHCEKIGAVLHAIDPEPEIDCEEWLRQHPASLKIYKDLSLNVLGTVPTPDVVFIDGDHNWYTVYHELMLIEKHARLNGHFPLILLHDIRWPYARRDMYYAPERIPDAFKKAYAKKGMIPESGLLQEKGGMNAKYYNAMEENDLENGVLTAIEDFLGTTKLDLRFLQIPGFHGLGIIAPQSLLTHEPALSAFLHSLVLSPIMQDYVENVESDRIERMLRMCTELRKMEKFMKEQKDEDAAKLLKLQQSRSWRWTLPLRWMEQELQSVWSSLFGLVKKDFRDIGEFFAEKKDQVASHRLMPSPYPFFASIRNIWVAFGEPFPGAIRFVRHSILGKLWPAEISLPATLAQNPEDKRPRVLLLVDHPHWAFATIAEAVKKHLGDAFHFEILAVRNKPVIDESRYDIIHVFFESEDYHLPYLQGKAKIVKSVYSHYWELEGLSPQDFYEKHLKEADAITVPSLKLFEALKDLPLPVHLVKEGLDTSVFTPKAERSGTLKVGWAGDPRRPIKRVSWLKEACDGVCELRLAEGGLSQEEMVNFYNSVDVIACSSAAEGCPRPLIEGMACGAFPVLFDVGIAREVIDHGKNGLIVEDASVQGLRTALRWCAGNLGAIRQSSTINIQKMRDTRAWSVVLPPLKDVYASVLAPR